jgi:hypothetical protein
MQDSKNGKMPQFIEIDNVDFRHIFPWQQAQNSGASKPEIEVKFRIEQ